MATARTNSANSAQPRSSRVPWPTMTTPSGLRGCWRGTGGDLLALEAFLSGAEARSRSGHGTANPAER